MHVADYVERTVSVTKVVPQPLAGDRCRGYVSLAGQHVDPVEALFAQAAKSPAELAVLLPEHVRAEVAVGTGGVARQADLFGQVEHDRHGQHVMLASERDERPARLRLHARGVDDGQTARGQPLAGDEVEHIEGIGGGRLVILIVAHQTTAEVGGQDLGWGKVPGCERRLARA